MISTDYTVTINATGRRFTVYDNSSNTGTPLGIVAAGDSASFVFSSGYITLVASSDSFSFNHSESGGVTYLNHSGLNTYYTVSADGEITISQTGFV